MIHFDFDYTGWERLQEKILQVPPRLGKKVSYGASKDAKTYLQSRIKYNRYNLLTAITARRETDEMYVIKARGKPSGYEKYVHDGRGSFSAKNKKALHWVDKSGKDVFVPKPKKVAAFRGYQHYYHAVKTTESKINKYVSETLKDVGL